MSIEVMKQALEALEYMHTEKCDYMQRNNLGDPLREDAARLAIPTIAALRTAIEAAEKQKPVAQRQPLTNEQIDKALADADVPELPDGYEFLEKEIARAIEAAHGIKEQA